MDAPAQDLAALYAREARRLIGEMYAITGDLGLAEETVAEAFTRAAADWERLRRYDEPAAWIRRVAVNLCLSQRRRVRRLRPLDERPHRDLAAPPAELLDLQAALAALPLAHRRAVVLHYLLGYPVADVGALLRVPDGTVKAWLSRGRAALRTTLTEEPCHD